MLAKHRPDSVVAWSPETTTSAAEMCAHVDGFAALLDPAEPGQELLVMCRDRYRFAVAMLAAWKRGYSVALPPNAQPDAVSAIRRRPGVVTVIHDGGGIAKGLDVRDPLVMNAARSEVGKVPFSTIPAMPPERLLATVYTSGSTGGHTACPKTASQLIGEARMLAETFPLSEGARVLPMVPSYHIYGLLFGVLVPLVSGGAFCRETPLHAAEVGAVGRVDCLVSVPAHLRGLLVAKRGELPLVPRVFSSAAPLAPKVADAVKERFGWTVTEVFGSSETGGIAWRESGGRGPWAPLPGVTVDVDADGRMLVDSPFLAPDAARPFVGADRVELREDGTFTHLGRTDGVLKIGGVRISLAEMERRLCEIDGVTDAAVVGVEVGGARGHEIWAAVVARPDVKTIRAALRGWLAPVAMPRRLKRVDSLPRSESGKLRRKDVLAIFQSVRDVT